MTARDDVEAERALLATSLELVGGGAEAGCGAWTAFDLAAHVVAADRAAGALAFCVRALAARGVQFRPKPSVVESVIHRERQAGYPALIDRFRRPSPRLLLTKPVAPSTLFEVWMHHDDLARTNDLGHGTPEHLAQAIPSLLRYQAGRLPNVRVTVRTLADFEWSIGQDAGERACVTGDSGDLVRWLAGRPPMTTLSIEAKATTAEQLRRFVGLI